MKSLEEKIRELPFELQKEVEDFVDFLVEKRKRKKGKALFNWEGALKELRDQFSSIELQHEISNWRKAED